MNNIIIPIVLLTLVSACGKKGGGSNSGLSQSALMEQQAQGSYRAILRPFNNSLNGFLPTGLAEIKIAGNNVEVKTLLDDDARVPHMQSIRLGLKCPTLQSDANRDGLIDYSETLKEAGPVMVSLDADLDSEDAGAGVYPLGGGFTYIENTNLENFQSDVKSRTGQNLNLAGRVVIIHGIAESAIVPKTMKPVKGMTPEASAPIACGVLYRVN